MCTSIRLYNFPPNSAGLQVTNDLLRWQVHATASGECVIRLPEIGGARAEMISVFPSFNTPRLPVASAGDGKARGTANVELLILRGAESAAFDACRGTAPAISSEVLIWFLISFSIDPRTQTPREIIDRGG